MAPAELRLAPHDEAEQLEAEASQLEACALRLRQLAASARSGRQGGEQRPQAPPQQPTACVGTQPAVLLKVPEAAKLASMTPRALRHAIQRGQLPRGVVVHRGRSVFIDRERFSVAIRKDRPGRS
jgi:hypothetical protein